MVYKLAYLYTGLLVNICSTKLSYKDPMSLTGIEPVTECINKYLVVLLMSISFYLI